jgi:ABC-type multidrug transport system ATPase subunit
LQEADTGSVFLNDIDVLHNKEEVRKILGYLPQEFGLYPKVSAEVLLHHIATLKGITRNKERVEVVDALLHKVNLHDVRKKNLGTFSGGMKQRFGIAQALIGNPRLIIVDEPTAGLDPTERNRFHNLLSEIGENTIVILSTHIVEDVSHLCNNMAIICKGELLIYGHPAQIIDAMQGKIWKKTVEKSQLDAYNKEFKVISTTMFAGKSVIHVYNDNQPDISFIPVETDLEDVYFTIISDKTSVMAL